MFGGGFDNSHSNIVGRGVPFYVTPSLARSILVEVDELSVGFELFGESIFISASSVNDFNFGGGSIIQIPLRHSRHPGYLRGLPPPPPPLVSSPLPPVPFFLF